MLSPICRFLYDIMIKIMYRIAVSAGRLLMPPNIRRTAATRCPVGGERGYIAVATQGAKVILWCDAGGQIIPPATAIEIGTSLIATARKLMLSNQDDN